MSAPSGWQGFCGASLLFICVRREERIGVPEGRSFALPGDLPVTSNTYHFLNARGGGGRSGPGHREASDLLPVHLPPALDVESCCQGYQQGTTACCSPDDDRSTLRRWGGRRGRGQAGPRDGRLQHVLARMNHHIHPLVNTATRERWPLQSCQPKNRPKE